MDNANLSLIHPEYQLSIYGGIALLTRNEAVKTVAMTTLSTQTAISLSFTISDHRLEECGQIQPTQMRKELVRSQNGTVRSLLHSVSIGVPCAAAIIGSLFALAARVPLSRLKQKVTMRQLSPFWLSGLALAVLTTELNARRVPIETDFYGKISTKCSNKTAENSSAAFFGTAIISMLAILVGTVAYRAGLIFKKPS